MEIRYTLLFLFSFVVLGQGQDNLLLNGDFEWTDYEGNLKCQGQCTLTPSTDAYTGNYSVKISNRTAKWNGPVQSLNTSAGSIYVITALTKMLTQPSDSSMFQEFKMVFSCLDSTDTRQYKILGRTPQVVPGEWRQVGGVYRVNEDFHDCLFYVQTEALVDYLVDNASAVLILADPNWKEKASQRIDQLRKADINVVLNDGFSNETEVELVQTALEFPFGSAVGASQIVDTNYQRYQQVFYNNFNYAVLENALKWKKMETTQGNINYNTPLSALNALHSHGTRTRCHCMFWAKEINSPDWLAGLYGEEMQTAINNRIQGVNNATTGKCTQWDVNNENLHGNFFEEHTGDRNITMRMFDQMHALDDNVELFLNDFGIISSEDATVAMKDTAVRYVEAGVPVAGIGVQGHLKTFDTELIKAKLDIVAEAGLPVMITEFSLSDENNTRKAENLESIVTMLYSLPYIKGILFWGFWDGKIHKPLNALYNGDNVTANAAGLAWERLYHSTWRTNVKLTGSPSFTVRGFKGSYTAFVKHNDTVLATQNFTLSDAGRTLEIIPGTIPTEANIIVS